MATLNYLTDAYQVFAASANGIALTCRSLFGPLLSLLAAQPMHIKLGTHGPWSLLAFLDFTMAVVAFVFITKGDRTRVGSRLGSRFCQYLKDTDQNEAVEEEKDRRTSETGYVGPPNGESG